MTKLSNQNTCILYYNKLKLTNYNLNKNFFFFNFYSNNYHTWFKLNPKLILTFKQTNHSDKVFNLGFFYNSWNMGTNFYLFGRLAITTKNNYNYFLKSINYSYIVFSYINFSKKFLFNTYFFLHFFKNFFKYPIDKVSSLFTLKCLKYERIFENSFRHSSASSLLLLNSSHI